jgi:hypothetical protein
LWQMSQLLARSKLTSWWLNKVQHAYIVQIKSVFCTWSLLTPLRSQCFQHRNIFIVKEPLIEMH